MSDDAKPLYLSPQPQGGGEVSQGAITKLKWFAGRARESGHAAQAQWLDDHIAALSTPSPRVSVEEIEATMRKHIYASAMADGREVPLIDVGGFEAAAEAVIRGLSPAQEGAE